MNKITSSFKTRGHLALGGGLAAQRDLLQAVAVAAVFGRRVQGRDGAAASADGAPRLLASLRANGSRLCRGSGGAGGWGVVPGRLGGKVPWRKKSNNVSKFVSPFDGKCWFCLFRSWVSNSGLGGE